MNTLNKNDKRATDPLERLIFEEGLRIKSIWFDLELDLMIVLLNRKKLIQRPISDFPRLHKASQEQLEHFENDGFGIHRPDLDEDLGSKGFLKYELTYYSKKVA